MNIEKTLIYILIAGVIITFIFIAYLSFLKGSSLYIKLVSPNGGEEWHIGSSYKISWKSKGISKIGIVLFKGKEPKWIAKNIDARLGEYDWKIYPGQAPGSDYWIAVFQYPWRKQGKIDFSDNSFSITFSEFVSCERLSAMEQWPYLPSDMLDLRRVFITSEKYSGNLRGFDGADKICQREAEKQGFSGNWKAFLGGDNDKETAVSRLEQSKRGKEGIFVFAKPEATLIRGASCHRLLAKNLEEFLKLFSDFSILNKQRLNKDFYNDFSELWLGRLTEKSPQNCVKVSETELKDLTKLYSFTATCQNWTNNSRFIVAPSEAKCYTKGGLPVTSAALVGLSLAESGEKFSPLVGRYCDISQKIICVEE